jgi:hypothetical protein
MKREKIKIKSVSTRVAEGKGESGIAAKLKELV